MKMLRSLGLALAASVAMLSAVAQAQSPTAFDGTYAGVSFSASGGNSCVPATPRPRALTVANSVATWPAGMTGDVVFTGDVNFAGELRMRSNLGIVVVGRIDPSGKVTAGAGASTGCTVNVVWQKQ